MADTSCRLAADCIMSLEAGRLLPSKSTVLTHRVGAMTRHPRMGTAKEPNVCGGERV